MNKFITIILLLAFVSPIVRLVFGFIPYLTIFFAISVFTLIFTLKINLKNYLNIWLTVSLLSMLLISIFTRGGSLESPFYAVLSLMSMFFSYWLVGLEKKKVTRLSFYALIIFYFYFFYSSIKYGISPQDVNNFFLESSRNSVSTVAILFQVFYSAAYYRENNKLPNITVIATMVICFISFGRTGIALGGLLVIVTYCSNFWSSRLMFKVLFFMFLFLGVVVAFQFFDEMQTFIINQTNFSSGLDSPRFNMIKDYWASLDFFSFFAGTELSSIPIINKYNNNPHNSIIYGHSQYGIFYIIFILSLFLMLAKKKLYSTGGWVYIVFVFIFFVRIFADKISLPGIFDYIFFYLFFAAQFDHCNLKRTS